MRINQVVIMPEFHMGNMGQRQANYCEHDIIDAYLSTLCEQLDYDKVEYRITSNFADVHGNTLIMQCRSGFGPVPGSGNYSTIQHKENSFRAAKIAAETISDWGKCYVSHGHKVKRKAVTEGDIWTIDGTMAISVEPFVPGGENHADYIRRLPQLGEMLAQTIMHLIIDMAKRA